MNVSDTLETSPTDEVWNFTYEGVEEPCGAEANRSPENFLQLFVHPVICLVGFVGNALVIATYALYKRTKSMTDVYLLNVAVADLLLVVALPLIIYSERHHWAMGSWSCKLLRGVYSVNVYSGMLLLACISADRYLAIVQARRSFRLRSRALPYSRLVCAAVWALALLLSLPTFIFYDRYQPGHNYIAVPNGEPYNGEPYNDKPYNGEPYNNEPYNDKLKIDEPYSDKPKIDEPYSDKLKIDEPYSDKLKTDKPYNEKPNNDEPYKDKPENDTTYNDELKIDKPYNDELKIDKLKIDKLKTDKPYNEKPNKDEPYKDKPDNDTTYNDELRFDKPYNEKLYSNTPYSDEPNNDIPYVCFFAFPSQATALTFKTAVPSFQVGVGFCLPLLVMGFCYASVVLTLLRARSFQRHRAVRVVLTVVLVFLVCHAPYNVTLLYSTVHMFQPQDCSHEEGVALALNLTQSLAYLHSCLNPLLYAFVGVNFRNHFRKILRDLWCLGKSYMSARQVSRATSEVCVSTRRSDNDAAATSFTM